MRWVERRVRVVHHVLGIVIGLLPEPLARCVAEMGAVRTRLRTETALGALRTLVAEQLPMLPAPLGFQPHRLGTRNRLRTRQHKMGPDPPSRTSGRRPPLAEPLVPRRQQHFRVLDAPALEAMRPPTRVLPPLDRVSKPRLVDRRAPVRPPEHEQPQVRLHLAVALGHLGEAPGDTLARAVRYWTRNKRRPEGLTRTPKPVSSSSQTM